MTSSSSSYSKAVQFDRALFEDWTERATIQTVSLFRSSTRNVALFHSLFFCLAFSETLALILFFPFFAKTALLAFCFAALFLTGFSYFVLRFYFEARKPAQLMQLRDGYTKACRNLFTSSNIGQSDVLLAHAIYRLIESLEGHEIKYYPLPQYLEPIKPIVEKFSLWCHWQDVFQMKELLHNYCIQLRIAAIKLHPVEPEAHAALANSYIALYKLYIDPRKIGKSVPYTFILNEYKKETTIAKFKKTAAQAIEELKIIDFFASSDPWVHRQLAAIYHDLEDSEGEMQEYEFLVEKNPADIEILFRLGLLYFQQGRTAQGLRVYERLRQLQESKAAELIQFYSASPL